MPRLYFLPTDCLVTGIHVQERSQKDISEIRKSCFGKTVFLDEEKAILALESRRIKRIAKIKEELVYLEGLDTSSMLIAEGRRLEN